MKTMCQTSTKSMPNTAYLHLENYLWNAVPISSFHFIKNVPGRCSQAHSSLSLSSAAHPHAFQKWLLAAIPTEEI